MRESDFRGTRGKRSTDRWEGRTRLSYVVEVIGLLGPSGADIVFIAEATVKADLLKVFAKLGVDDRTRAVTIALERGILPGP